MASTRSASQWSNLRAWAAILADGSMVGSAPADAGYGPLPSSLDGVVDVKEIFSNTNAFAALLVNGAVVSWGQPQSGGTGAALPAPIRNGTDPIQTIFSSSKAFAALSKSGSIHTWGDSAAGGDSSSVAAWIRGSSAVQQVVSTSTGFAALLGNGSIVSWGAGGGGIVPSFSANISSVALYSSSKEVGSLNSDGSFYTWDPQFPLTAKPAAALTGGSPANRVRAIFLNDDYGSDTDLRWVAQLEDGRIRTWTSGSDQFLTYALPPGRSAVKLFSSGGQYAILLDNKSLVALNSNTPGSANFFPNNTTLSTIEGSFNTVDVVASKYGFAALKDDGSVICWGGSTFLAGSFRAVANQVDGSTNIDGSNDKVKQLATDGDSFIALRNDGRIVRWKASNSGSGQLFGIASGSLLAFDALIQLTPHLVVGKSLSGDLIRLSTSSSESPKSIADFYSINQDSNPVLSFATPQSVGESKPTVGTPPLIIGSNLLSVSERLPSGRWSVQFINSLQKSYSDLENHPLKGVALTEFTEDSQQGTWFYKSLSSADWKPLPSIAKDQFVQIDPQSGLQFQPTANFTGSPVTPKIVVLDASASYEKSPLSISPKLPGPSLFELVTEGTPGIDSAGFDYTVRLYETDLKREPKSVKIDQQGLKGMNFGPYTNGAALVRLSDGRALISWLGVPSGIRTSFENRFTFISSDGSTQVSKRNGPVSSISSPSDVEMLLGIRGIAPLANRGFAQLEWLVSFDQKAKTTKQRFLINQYDADGNRVGSGLEVGQFTSKSNADYAFGNLQFEVLADGGFLVSYADTTYDVARKRSNGETYTGSTNSGTFFVRRYSSSGSLLFAKTFQADNQVSAYLGVQNPDTSAAEFRVVRLADDRILAIYGTQNGALRLDVIDGKMGAQVATRTLSSYRYGSPVPAPEVVATSNGGFAIYQEGDDYDSVGRRQDHVLFFDKSLASYDSVLLPPIPASFTFNGSSTSAHLLGSGPSGQVYLSRYLAATSTSERGALLDSEATVQLSSVAPFSPVEIINTKKIESSPGRGNLQASQYLFLDAEANWQPTGATSSNSELLLLDLYDRKGSVSLPAVLTGFTVPKATDTSPPTSSLPSLPVQPQLPTLPQPGTPSSPSASTPTEGPSATLPTKNQLISLNLDAIVSLPAKLASNPAAKALAGVIKSVATSQGQLEGITPSASSVKSLSELVASKPLIEEARKLLDRYTIKDPDSTSTRKASDDEAGFIDFTLKTGALKSLNAEIQLASEVKATAYVKVNPNTGEAFDFTYDPITGLGAELLDTNKNGLVDTLRIHLQDGARGDADGLVNGEIRDPGVLAEAPRAPVYRFYRNGVHFYTTSDAERDAVIQKSYGSSVSYSDLSANPQAKDPITGGWGYRFEGIAYQALDTQGTALYRFFSPSKGYHFVTTSSAEALAVIQNSVGSSYDLSNAQGQKLLDKGWGFQFEGNTYKVSTIAQTGMENPVYRFFNGQKGVHFYSSSMEETKAVIANSLGAQYATDDWVTSTSTAIKQNPLTSTPTPVAGGWGYSFEGISWYV